MPRDSDHRPERGEAPEAASAPMPALFPKPGAIAAAGDHAGRDSFFWPGGLVDAWFIRRSDILLVTFDNLGSIGEYEPPQPWLQARAAKGGFSILGLIASQRDWYRNEDAPRLLRELQAAGFFAGFRRVLFVGASMGGFAALSLSALVPGAAVLAFSPQTSLAPDLVPFEKRYRYASRRWDWQGPGRDAAESSAGREICVLYDPFIAEDRAHVQRLGSSRLTLLRAPLLGHRAIRQLKALGLLQGLIEAMAEGRLDAAAFAKALRARRGLLPWQKALLTLAAEKGHHQLALGAARHLARLEPESRFPRRFARRLRDERKAESRAQEITRQVIGTPPAPFTGEILTIPGALVLPERPHDRPNAAGVLTPGGDWVELSKAWIRARVSSPAPALAPGEAVVDLPGTHLFAGHFRGHFGHFLVESTARLWALDHLKIRPDSLLYLPYRGEAGAVRRAIKAQAPFFRLLGLDLPVQTFATPLRVERLILPELGFGWLERYAGSPAYRAFMQSRLSAAAPAEGGEKLYISRARLNPAKGGVLGERVIEENLAARGYEIFHPEKHPLEVQIARYKAARQIVALDGSALHLAAYVMPAGGKVAMILRRSAANVADYQLQYRAFLGLEIDVIRVIRNDWVAGDAGRADYRSIGELDFPRLFAELAGRGYLEPGFRPDCPSEPELLAMLESYEDRRGQTFRALLPGEAHGAEEEG